MVVAPGVLVQARLEPIAGDLLIGAPHPVSSFLLLLNMRLAVCSGPPARALAVWRICRSE